MTDYGEHLNKIQERYQPRPESQHFKPESHHHHTPSNHTNVPDTVPLANVRHMIHSIQHREKPSYEPLKGIPPKENANPQDEYIVQSNDGVWMKAYDLLPEQSHLLNALIPQEHGHFIFRKNAENGIYTAHDINNRPVFVLHKVGGGASRDAYRLTCVNEADPKNYGATWVMTGDNKNYQGGAGTYTVPQITAETCQRPLYLDSGEVVQVSGPYKYLPEITDDLTIFPADVGGILGKLNVALSLPLTALGAAALSIERHQLEKIGVQSEELHNTSFMIRNKPPGLPIPRFKWKESKGKRKLTVGIAYVNIGSTELSVR